MSTLDTDLQAQMNQRSKVDASFRFEMRPGVDEAASKEVGKQVYKDEPWVIMRPKGDPNNSTEFRADRLQRSRPELYQAIQPYYEAWKNGQEEPLDGTPLKGWSGVTEAQRLTLANFNLKTVEDVANATDSMREKIPQFTKLQQVAKNYLQGDGSKLALQNASLQEELKEKGSLIDQQQKDIDDLKAQVAALVKAKK